jgi:hypothetical protein
MSEGGAPLGAGEDENISRTYVPAGSPSSAPPCGYIVAGTGGRARFCDAPAERGSSYCRRHRALCAVDPGSPEAAAILAEFEEEAERPPLPGVGCDPLLETPLATEPEEVLGELAGAERADEEEGR